jgi:hypothetical protein
LRTRTTTYSTFDTTQTWYEWNVNGTVYLGPVNTLSGTLDVKTIEDVVTPNFKSKLECGKFLPLNPVHIVRRRETRNPGPVTNQKLVTPGSGPYRFSGTYAGWLTSALLPEEPTIDQDIVDTVVNTAAAKAAEAEWDVLTFMGELKQTTNMMAQIIHLFNTRVADLARRARRAARSPKEAIDIFTTMWLGYRYGIRPLLYDMQSAQKALARLGGEYDFSRGASIQEVNLYNEADSTYQDSISKYDINAVCTGNRKYRGVAYASFDSDWARSFGADPLTTAWELVPYSFVVDWFVDIGSWVQTLTPQLAGRYLGIGYSIKDELEITQTWTGNGPRNGWDCNNGPFVNVITIERYRRGPASVSFPPVLPQVTLPRLVDLVALAFQGRRNVASILGARR